MCDPTNTWNLAYVIFSILGTFGHELWMPFLLLDFVYLNPIL